jgi:hypothetical protein
MRQIQFVCLVTFPCRQLITGGGGGRRRVSLGWLERESGGHRVCQIYVAYSRNNTFCVVWWSIGKAGGEMSNIDVLSQMTNLATLFSVAPATCGKLFLTS